MTWKTVSCKIDEEDFDTITSCIENGGAESVSKFVRDAIEHEIENSVVSLEFDDEHTSKPTLTKTIPEPIKVKIENGGIWSSWYKQDGGYRTRTKIGNVEDFTISNGKIYVKNSNYFKEGSLYGIIENE